MENSAGSGLGKRLLAWAVLIVIGLIAAKLVLGALIGLATLLMTIVLIVAAVWAVLWALRHI
jgi:hypothetical protein